MDILLWRHAEAEDGPDDMARALTKKGREQARVMAEWIRAHGPQGLRVLVSPALRTRQTAEALTDTFSLSDQLAPDSTVARAMSAMPAISSVASAPQATQAAQAAYLLVGHQPTLGQLAATLVAGQPDNWSIRKGSLWWLKLRERGGLRKAVIVAVVQPDHGHVATTARRAR